MPEPSSPSAGDEPARTLALAGRLSELAALLAKLPRRATNAAGRHIVAASPEALKHVCTSLEGMADAIDAGRADLLVGRRRELDALMSCLAENLRALGGTNERLAAQLGRQASELDAAGRLPPGQAVARRLRDIATGMREAVGELGSHLSSAATQAQSASRRAAALAARSTPPAPPEPPDTDTGLCSREALDARLRFLIATAPFRGPWSLLLVDIDAIDELSERSSALACDMLLTRIAGTLAEHVGENCPEALLAEHSAGGFAVIVPGKLAAALMLAERIRRSVAAVSWPFAGRQETIDLSTTASIGVAPCRRGDTAAGLLRRTARAVEQARREGPGRVVAAE